MTERRREGNTIVLVSRQGTRLAAILVAAALTFAFAACGGSNSESSSSSDERSTATALDGGAQESGGQSGEGTKGSENSPGGEAETSPLRVSGGGSGQFRVKGGDNSIQDFGEESGEDELEEAAGVLHGFLVARARSEWDAACAKLSHTVQGQLAIIAKQAKQGATGCATTLAAITPSLSSKVVRETTAVDAGSLRVEGDRGFLLYRDEEGTVYAINMTREDGGWKVGALAGVPLS